MRLLASLLKVVLLIVGFVIIAGGTLGSLCGMLNMDVGVTLGGALVALFGVGLYMVVNKALGDSRAEAAENYAELVARHDASLAQAPERQDDAGGSGS
ncbi:MAG: hypothetical protein H6R14_1398 [Proteobacteria bacterium]|nr:hypothetical protein [Pseudomonadota bacterium]